MSPQNHRCIQQLLSLNFELQIEILSLLPTPINLFHMNLK